jgi:hypothetical protein
VRQAAPDVAGPAVELVAARQGQLVEQRQPGDAVELERLVEPAQLRQQHVADVAEQQQPRGPWTPWSLNSRTPANF